MRFQVGNLFSRRKSWCDDVLSTICTVEEISDLLLWTDEGHDPVVSGEAQESRLRHDEWVRMRLSMFSVSREFKRGDGRKLEQAYDVITWDLIEGKMIYDPRLPRSFSCALRGKGVLISGTWHSWGERGWFIFIEDVYLPSSITRIVEKDLP